MLKRDIGKWDLVLLLINGIIGAGIFGLPSKIFALSGVYSIIALLVVALITFILVLVFSEVASRFNKTGGPYLYTLTAFGRFPAYTIGWLLLITRLAAYAALINLFVTYLGYFHPVFLMPLAKISTIFIFTLFLTIVNIKGVKNAAILSNILAIAKISTLLIFIVVGLFHINPDLLDFHVKTPSLPDFSASVLILIFAFSGFEAVIVNTGEIKNPRKNIPFALIISIVFVAIFYTLIQIVSIGNLPDLASSDKPLTDVAQSFMGPFGGLLITIGALISIGGTLNAVMLMTSRVPFALSEENQFPKLFSYLHPKYQTPIYSLIAFSFVSMLASFNGSFIYAVSISVISTVLVFLVVSIILIKLRLSDKKATNFFKLPFGYFFASLGILTSIWLLSNSKLTEFRDVLITIIIGLVIYALYKITKRKK